ncbi:hypothetical protein AB0368_06600 [Actinoplanes sp. NPDC051475]|uniref:hypothetical protein n=1 Tax=Actinoplanes sp. NPDC051475 TaxID=3157225 RepID=UPI00344D882E
MRVGSGAWATTTTAAIAALWPETDPRTPMLVEADASGGDLAARLRLPVDPGLVQVAADARHGAPADVLHRHAQQAQVAGRQLPVVVAPPGPAQARVALPTLVRSGALRGPADTVLHIDAGRIAPHDPAWPLLAQADAVVAVVRAHTDALAHLAAINTDLQRAAGPRLVILLADGVYPPQEVATAFDVAVLPMSVPTDAQAAAILSGQLDAGRRWRRLPLFCAAADIAASLSEGIDVSLSDEQSVEVTV